MVQYGWIKIWYIGAWLVPPVHTGQDIAHRYDIRTLYRSQPLDIKALRSTEYRQADLIFHVGSLIERNMANVIYAMCLHNLRHEGGRGAPIPGVLLDNVGKIYLVFRSTSASALRSR